MIAYLVRLVSLSLACFFLVNLAAGVAVGLVAPRAMVKAHGMRAASAARFLFALRLTPMLTALFAVVAMCIPSYLWLEPASASEDFGIVCAISAALGLVVIARAFWRGAQAVMRSRRFASSSQEISIIDAPGAIMATTGLLRPRILVSRAAADALTADQFDAAVQHEHAHFTSRDNLKRLLLIAAPEILPLVRTGARVVRNVDREWAKFSEWTADDRAVAGDVDRAISLAEALVTLARNRTAQELPPLATSLLADPAGLSARVERLLSGAALADPPRDGLKIAGVVAATLFACVMLANPATLAAVHELLERFFQ
jgi:beta-lactamase regulating signal transducer with metallopeptidase domain